MALAPEKHRLLRFDFVEIYGGSGRVSKAATDFGLVTAPPLDLDASHHYDLAQPRLVEWVFYMIESGRFRSFLTEPPCTTFSAAAYPALRSYLLPFGFDPSEKRTKHGNLLACRSFLLLRTWPPAQKALWKRAAQKVKDGLVESMVSTQGTGLQGISSCKLPIWFSAPKGVFCC